MHRKTIPLVLCAAGAVLLAGCATPTAGPSAVAQLTPTRGNNVAGTVRFQQVNERVRVSGEIRGLRPGSEHGFHVHERGDCSSGDGMSAGGHFNPDNRPHGHPAAAPHHVGDMPNLRADAAGVARFDFEAAGLRVGSGAADVVGRGLIVHRDPDDYRSQPAGNAGPRLACAVISRA